LVGLLEVRYAPDREQVIRRSEIRDAQERKCQGECELSAKLYCCADQFSIVRSHSTIWQMNSVLKSNPGREIEAPSLANTEPNAAGFAMQEDRQSAICSIKYREDLMSLF